MNSAQVVEAHIIFTTILFISALMRTIIFSLLLEWLLFLHGFRIPGECFPFICHLIREPRFCSLGFWASKIKFPRLWRNRSVVTKSIRQGGSMAEWLTRASVSQSGDPGFESRCNHILAPVVRKADSAIHWINFYPVDSAIGFPNTYPWDSDLYGR